MTVEKKDVCIVVLGDIGRSPRMQYHSLSLAEKGHKVDILGYGDSELLEEIKASPSIYYHFLMPVPQLPFRFINYAFKTIFQAINLLFLLITIRTPQILMVQNPPAIPSLVICWLFCRIVRAKFIIDWHNYGYTLMALKESEDSFLVKITKKCEMFIGAKADHNFCVTKAMRDDLSSWKIESETLYDKSPKIFKAISLEEKHNFLVKIAEDYRVFISDDNSSAFTEVVNGTYKEKTERPGLLVSSTSWTDDEDFSILFSALQEYENQIIHGNQGNLPNLVCIITGKGQLKEYYKQKITEEKWKHVQVITPWLESSDYPLILASADLGVCLHTSSSGLDLPMKIVDMFGCCLPVLAYDYPCLKELVINGKNGYTFKSSDNLKSQLISWFENFPNNEKQNEIIDNIRANLQTFQKLRWQENWNNIAYSAFQ